jgi:uncharacterized membrane protein (DUF106 family)
MWIFNSVFGKIFEVIFLPFRSLNPWFGMLAISIITGILMLVIFRWTSNQEGIRNAKNKIKAHLLELRLYKDSLGQSLKSQAKILSANFSYIGYALKPMLVMIIPIMLILIQLNLWFGSHSLVAGQEVLCKITLKKGSDPLQAGISLEAPSALEVETPPLRIEEEREIAWRLRAKENGIHTLTFHWNQESFTKSVAVGQKKLSRISVLKPGPDFFGQLFNPGERPLPKQPPVESIKIAYPAKRMNFFGLHVHWLVTFFIFSIVFGFALKGVFKVEI